MWPGIANRCAVEPVWFGTRCWDLLPLLWPQLHHAPLAAALSLGVPFGWLGHLLCPLGVPWSWALDFTGEEALSLAW